MLILSLSKGSIRFLLTSLMNFIESFVFFSMCRQILSSSVQTLTLVLETKHVLQNSITTQSEFLNLLNQLLTYLQIETPKFAEIKASEPSKLSILIMHEQTASASQNHKRTLYLHQNKLYYDKKIICNMLSIQLVILKKKISNRLILQL